MGEPKNAEELEVWTRFACAVVATTEYHYAALVADNMLDQWRSRRDAIEAAERESEAERVAAAEAERALADAQRAEAARATREALNAAEWEIRGEGYFRRCAGDSIDHVQEASFGWALYLYGGGCIHLAPAAEWPADMGSPPPGWVLP